MVSLILVTGFLGAGKTTLINEILSQNQSIPISVILNEFGNSSLESRFITQKNGEVIELANGCMCCVAKSDVPRIVRLILEKSPQTQYILIEASGISDLDPVTETLSDSTLRELVRLDCILCVVDAAEFESQRRVHPIVMSQVGDSDIVIINKTQDVPLTTITSIRTCVHTLDPQIVILQDVHSLSLEAIIDVAPLTHHGRVRAIKHTHPDHSLYSHVLIQTDKVPQFDVLSQRIKEYGDAIIRVKGVLINPSDHSQALLYQKVGPRVSLDSRPWKDQEPHSSVLLCVGMHFDQKALEQELLKCFIDGSVE